MCHKTDMGHESETLVDYKDGGWKVEQLSNFGFCKRSKYESGKITE